MNTITTTLHGVLNRRKHDGTALTLTVSSVQRPIKHPRIDIVIPVYNEAVTLAKQVERLRAHLDGQVPYDCTIVIADNGSSDTTWQIARGLQQRLVGVKAVHLDEPGRGRALKTVWLQSEADIMAYMDVDLSTDLDALVPLLQPLVEGKAEVATGSRLRSDSKVTRSLKREVISRAYNRLLRTFLGLKVSDAQCGFKAITREFAQKVLPQVTDTRWFFDTELLVRAERSGLVVHQVAIDWREDTDSRVNIMKTARDDLKGIHRLRRELSARPRWERIAAGLLAAGTGILYAIGAAQNGYGNSFYAAAVQAGTHSWKAFFFGSLDAANYITVDKPPFSLWAMELSTRLFGFHSWSMLLPEVLAGVATVYLVYATVRRWFGAVSGLIAGMVTALTPVAVLMFGFNNPDAVLTFLLTLSVYALVRALDSHRPLAWLALMAVATGSAFNTKMLQGLIIIPVLMLVYLIAAEPKLFVRLRQLVVTGMILAVAALWWPVIVSLTPADSRPYIGSSTDNSVWNLILGYNGVGRLLGNSTGQGGGTRPTGGQGFGRTSTSQTRTTSAALTPPTGAIGTGTRTGRPGGGGGPGGSGFGGSTGIFRMFNSDFGPNIAWFIPAGLITTGLALWQRRRAKRTDKLRAGYLLWGGYLVMHIIVFSMVSGVIHPYYPVVMAPAVGALIGMATPLLYRGYRRGGNAALALPLTIAATAVTACILLGYQTSFLPALRWIVLLGGLLLSSGLLVNLYRGQPRLSRLTVGLAALVCLISPAVYALDTVTVTHTGSIPSAGPTGTGLQGSNNESATAEGTLIGYLLAHQGTAKWLVAVASANQSAGIQIASGQPVMAVGGFNGGDDALSVSRLQALIASGKLRYYAVSSSGQGGGPGMGNSAVLTWIQAHATKVNYGGNQYTLYDLSQAGT